MELKNYWAQDSAGNVIADPTVYLYQPGTTTAASGLQTAAGSALTNPFTGSASGQITFAAPDGDYDMRVVGGGREVTMRVRFIATSGGGGSSTDINVRDYGAVGDGAANDSTAIMNAVTAAQAAGKGVFFPDGVYYAPSLSTLSGRLHLTGEGSATIKGNVVYHHATFPVSADTATPLTITSPYFTAHGLNFESLTSDYGLKLSTVEQPNFINTFTLSHCKFYGNKGLLTKHMIGFDISHTDFNTRVTGARIEGGVNGVWTAVRFNNHAEAGIWITNTSDHGTSGVVDRAGGENMKFVNCEWAVCTYGIVADQHMWLTIDSCLLDYCAIPLFLSGAVYTKADNTYFGTSNVPVTRHSGVAGYLAPVINGVAVYGRPGGYTLGDRVVGFTAHNCEFVNYTAGVVQPLVYIDGYVDSGHPMSGEEVTINDCLFYATQPHSAPNLLEISSCKIVNVTGNRFVSLDKSTSMTNAYRINNCMSQVAHSNNFYHCRQSGVILGSASEKPVATVVLSASDPGAIGAGNIWVQP